MQVSVIRKGQVGQVFFCPIIWTDDDWWKDSSIVYVQSVQLLNDGQMS